jgi:hypothetical protein
MQNLNVSVNTVKPVYNSHPWYPKNWPLYMGGRSVEVFQSKLVSMLAWPDLYWPLVTGGRCSQVAVNTGLTVLDVIL